MSQTMLKFRWPAEPRVGSSVLQTNNPLPIIVDTQTVTKDSGKPSRTRGSHVGSPKLGYQTKSITAGHHMVSGGGTTHMVIPTISVDTSALYSQAQHISHYGAGYGAYTTDYAAHGTAPGSRAYHKISSQPIIAFMEFVEKTDREMAQEVRRVKESVKDLRRCIRALKKERKKEAEGIAVAEGPIPISECGNV